MAEKTKLTKRAVDAAEPGERRRILWDTELAGFGLRVETSGRKVYLIRYRLGGGRRGTQRETVVGPHGVLTAEEARRRARKLLADVVQGEDPLAEKRELRDARGMEELFARYLEEHAAIRKKPRSAKGDADLIRRHLRPALGRRKVVEITRGDVQDLLWKMRETPVLANRARALLSKMMNLAEVWGWRPENANPCRGVDPYEETPRERYLSASEIERLGDTLRLADETGFLTLPAKPGLRDEPKTVAASRSAIGAIRVILFTGARNSEVRSLQWDWLDTTRGLANLPDSKTGKKPLYLPPPALEVIQGMPRVPGNPHVFAGQRPGSHISRLYRVWHAALEVAEIDRDTRIHDLRHSFASVAAANGMSLQMIGKLLGHRSQATTARYAHLADDPVRAASEGVGSRIAALEGRKRSEAELVSLEARRGGAKAS